MLCNASPIFLVSVAGQGDDLRESVFAGTATGPAGSVMLFIALGKNGVPVAGEITMFLPIYVMPIDSLTPVPLPRN